MCLFVCFLSPPRSFGRSSPNLLGVCRLTSHLPLRGSFSKRSTPRRVNGSLSLSTILYMPQPHATQLQRRLLLGKQQSLIRRLLLSCMSTTYVGWPGNCYWGVLFLKGRRVKRDTFTFTILYMIADDARLTPPRCKKHTGSMGQRVTFTFTILYMIADDARLTPPRCKKHTASFTRSTGKFTSKPNEYFCLIRYNWFIMLLFSVSHELPCACWFCTTQ